MQSTLWNWFKTIDFEQVNEYQDLRKYYLIGFAELYLEQCNKESGSNGKVDINVYRKLVELDTKLGTTASEQLYKCLNRTRRSDIIKVRKNEFNTFFNNCGAFLAFKDFRSKKTTQLLIYLLILRSLILSK